MMYEHMWHMWIEDIYSQKKCKTNGSAAANRNVELPKDAESTSGIFDAQKWIIFISTGQNMVIGWGYNQQYNIWMVWTWEMI